MKKRILPNLFSSYLFAIILILILQSNNSFSQINWTWAASGGSGMNDWSWSGGNGVDFDQNNNTYLVGFISSPAKVDSLVLNSYGYEDILIAKYDKTGNVVWAKTAGGKYGDIGKSVKYINGYLYVCGTYCDTAYFDNHVIPGVNYNTRSFFVAKLDTNGNYIWIKYGCNHVNSGWGIHPIFSLNADSYNNIYLSGFCRDNSQLIDTIYNCNPPQSAFFITQLDSSGNMNWTYFRKTGTISGPHTNAGIDLKIDQSNNLIYASSIPRIDSIKNSNNLLLGKISISGNLIWEKEIGDTSSVSWDGFPLAISLGANDNIFMSGLYQKSFLLNPSFLATFGGFIAKFNSSNGSIISAIPLVSSNNTCPFINGCDYDYHGNIFYSGYFKGSLNFGGITLSSISYNSDNFVACYDTSGTLNWAVRYGYNSEDILMGSSADFNMYSIVGIFIDSLTLDSITLIADTFNANSRSFFIATYINPHTIHDTIQDTLNVISVPNANLFFKIYPNPTSSKIIIETEDNIDQYTIEIYSIESKIIKRYNSAISNTIDVSSLKPGAYFISLRNDKVRVVKRFVKN